MVLSDSLARSGEDTSLESTMGVNSWSKQSALEVCFNG
jgi:hypothetical protein